MWYIHVQFFGTKNPKQCQFFWCKFSKNCWRLTHLKKESSHSMSFGFGICLKFFAPLEDFSLILETSPLPVKGCKFQPMLDTYGH